MCTEKNFVISDELFAGSYEMTVNEMLVELIF